MRVWLACFLVLFGLSELFQWMKQISLPLPVFILGGAFLAIASNYDKRAGFPFDVLNSRSASETISPTASQPVVSARPDSKRQPISFTIRKPEQ